MTCIAVLFAFVGLASIGDRRSRRTGLQLLAVAVALAVFDRVLELTLR